MEIMKILNSRQMIYIYFAIIFVVVFFTTTSDHKEYGTFRAEEIGAVQKIINPEFYDGKLFNMESMKDNPYFNYAYMVTFVAKKFGYQQNLWELGKIFWFVEKGISLIVIIMLCNLIFPGDRITLLIAGTFFVSFIDHEASQKSMAMPLYLLSIYYFLKERWITTAIFSASIFYLHIGKGVWWLGAAGFALLAMFLIQKRISLKNIIIFGFTTVALASPILYYYFLKNSNSSIDKFTIMYFYYIQQWQTSPLLALTITPFTFFNQWLTFAILCLGYISAKKAGYDHGNILLLAMGAIVLYFVQFVFADVLSSSFIIPMQLTRAFHVVQVFGNLFIAFLLAGHIRKGNYIFVSLVLFMYLTHHSHKSIVLSIILLIFYEILEKPAKDLAEKVFCRVKIDLENLRKR